MSFGRVFPERGSGSCDRAEEKGGRHAKGKGDSPKISSVISRLKQEEQCHEGFDDFLDDEDVTKTNFTRYTLKFTDKSTKERYDAERGHSLSSGLAIFLLFGCGTMWGFYCPRPMKGLSAWHNATSVIFYFMFILPLALFLVLRTLNMRCGGLPPRFIGLKNVFKRAVPIGGSLACGVELLARSL
jgi:hypothetical protein